MKAKSLFLLGLSAVALASCGGVKGYKTEVKNKVFKEEIEKILDSSILLDLDENFSFEIEATSESKTVETYLKNGKDLSEKITVSKSESNVRYDSNNYVIRSEGTYDSREIEEDREKIETFDGEMVYQKDKKNTYEINLETKLYEKEAASNPEEAIHSNAAAKISAIRYALSSMEMSGDDVKDFIDENVYTCEITTNEESDKTSKKGKTVYQVVVESDRISFFSESQVTLKALNYTEVIKDKGSFILTKKNVTLKEVDLEKYLENSNTDEVDYTYLPKISDEMFFVL